jgi:hypothetical protein
MSTGVEATEAKAQGVDRIGAVRILVGLIQGLLLYLVQDGWIGHFRLLSDPVVHAALFGAVFFGPIVFIAGLTAFRRPLLGVWTVAATVIAALLMGYAVWRDLGDPMGVDLRSGWWLAASGVVVAASLFVGNHLLEASEIDRRFLGAYPSYFEPAWKHGVQGALAILFTAAFWLLLYVGGALFDAIQVKLVSQVIGKPWFYWPATAAAFAAAVHLTDVRAGLVRGVRMVALTLLAWLTPVLALLAGAFVLTLPFTGLDPLWRTRAAASILLSAASLLILLINAAYQDGSEPPSVVLRWAVRAAAAILAPLVVLAVIGIGLRIGQYGLSPQRILSLAWALIAGGYATGYLASAIVPGRWMRGLERVNVAQAWLILALISLLFTPILDPERLAVTNQVGRLASGKTDPRAFDYAFLKFETGRFGRAALAKAAALTGSARNLDIAVRAAQAMKWTNKWQQDATRTTLAERAQLITVYPKERTLPPGLLEQDWTNNRDVPDCLSGRAAIRCDAFLLDLEGAGSEDVLMKELDPKLQYTPVVFRRNGDRWEQAGTVVESCPGLLDGLRAGAVELVPPSPPAPAWRDLLAGGVRYRVIGPSPSPPACPKARSDKPDR